MPSGLLRRSNSIAGHPQTSGKHRAAPAAPIGAESLISGGPLFYPFHELPPTLFKLLVVTFSEIRCFPAILNQLSLLTVNGFQPDSVTFISIPNISWRLVEIAVYFVGVARCGRCGGVVQLGLGASHLVW